jgi:hypothetical protein
MNSMFLPPLRPADPPYDLSFIIVTCFLPVKLGSFPRAARVTLEVELAPSDLFAVRAGLLELFMSLMAIAEVTG